MRQRQRIPNFRNLGIIFRTLLLVNGLLILLAFTKSAHFAEFIQLTLQYSSLTQPILMVVILIFYVCAPYLKHQRYGIAVFFLWLIALCSALLTLIFLEEFLFIEYLPAVTKTCVLTSALFLVVFYYFYLIDKAYSPAIQEARIQALQARIRPHFLFNSINTVLSLIRHQPQQAETALEDMADLFRVLMADNRDLVPLSREIALCKQYCALEKCRLEERLSVEWQIQEPATHVLVPSLILQPLLENAVYHGIEPLVDGGRITIEIYLENNFLNLRITNPIASPSSNKSQQHHGNLMAIQNIKERLNLHFDLEARLHIKQSATTYQTHIVLPNQAHFTHQSGTANMLGNAS